MQMALMIPHLFSSGAALTAGSTALASGGGLFSAGTMAGATIGAASGSAGILGMITNGLSIASVAGNLFGGMQQSNAASQNAEMQARAATGQAQEELLQAKQEEILGKRDANDITDRMIRTISEQRLAFSANGMDPTFGTPKNVEESSRDIANLQLSTSRNDARVRVMARRRGAAERMIDRTNILASGKASSGSAMMGGLASAAGTLGDLATRSMRRG